MSQVRFDEPNENGVAVVWIDQPDRSVNVLNTESLPEFKELMEKVRGTPSVKALLIASAKENCFVAGADAGQLHPCTQ